MPPIANCGAPPIAPAKSDAPATRSATLFRMCGVKILARQTSWVIRILAKQAASAPESVPPKPPIASAPMDRAAPVWVRRWMEQPLTIAAGGTAGVSEGRCVLTSRRPREQQKGGR